MASNGPQILEHTLNNEGVVPDSLAQFKKFLREVKDGNDEDQTDSNTEQGDWELHLEFLFDVNQMNLKNLGLKYFSPDPNADYRIGKALKMQERRYHYYYNVLAR